jgi:hypothetical protein
MANFETLAARKGLECNRQGNREPFRITKIKELHYVNRRYHRNNKVKTYESPYNKIFYRFAVHILNSKAALF